MDKQSNTSSAQEFFQNGIRVVKLTDWLNWVIDRQTTSDKWMVALPMIQRGAVWKPHQVIDLWDTILRGMPFGGLMASHILAESDAKFFHPITRELVLLPTNGGLSLIDGQQRTLSMLMAWPAVGEQMNRRIWVDLGEDDNYDHLLQFYLTTESQPFGFQKGGASGASIAKLSLSERRLAAAAYANCTSKPLLYADEITPWKSVFALDLRQIIEEFQKNQENLPQYIKDEKKKAECVLNKIISFANENHYYNEELKKQINQNLQNRLSKIKNLTEDDLDKRIETLQKGLNKLSNQHFPVIEVPSEMISAQAINDKQDPPLAVLFKRIGTGGTDLKTSDYVYSVIKHLYPECHSLVETQLKDEKISAIYSPTDLVMSAVRLTAAKLGCADSARLDKPQFNRLMRGIEKGKNEKSDPFLPEFNSQISNDGSFVKNLNALLTKISYTTGGDIGFPKHALCLVKISVLEVVLYWMQQLTQIDFETNRLPIIRFILCWSLTVSDSFKASESCFKFLKENKCEHFPEESLVDKLIAEKIALPMRSPDELKEIATLPVRRKGEADIPTKLTHSPEDVTGLRGWRRFVANTDGIDNEVERTQCIDAVSFYKRWWNLQGSGYSHLFLLWLQRDYVFSKFEAQVALPGQGEDTPYDFDHICPRHHWYGWTGITKFHAENISGLDGEGHWRLGNAIGNVRIWDSSDNRSDGDSAPSVKLNTEVFNKNILKDSCIEGDEIVFWKGCDPIDTINANPKYWTKDRALAFQKAIELRTFNLYTKFWKDLKFKKT